MTSTEGTTGPTPIRKGVIIEENSVQRDDAVEVPEIVDPIGQVAEVISLMANALSLATADDPGAVERYIHQKLQADGYSPEVQVQAIHSFNTLTHALLMGTLTKKPPRPSRLRAVRSQQNS